MTKTLQKYGNSHALVIDKALMDATGITPETPLNVTVTGDTIVVKPTNVGVGRERVDELMKQVVANYGNALKKLAE